MPIEFSCPSCRQLVRTPDTTAGKKGKCPHCRSVVQIPAPRSAGKLPSKSPSAAPQPNLRGAAAGAGPAAAASTVEFFCVECGQLVRTPAAAAGKKGKCPNCRAVIDIPRKREPGGSGVGSREAGFGRQRSGGASPPQIEGDDLAELPELSPMDGDLEPLSPDPLAGYASPTAASTHGSHPPSLPDLTPLIDEVLPTIPALPAGGGGLPSGSPFAAGSQPRRIFSNVGRDGLPWERDPSTDSFFETLKLVISAPQEAFEMMRRTGGIGNPFGYLLFSSVLAYFLVVLISFVLELLRAIIFWVFSSKQEPLTIHWDAMFLALGAVACVAIIAAIAKGTLGGLISASIYHLCLLVCGGARNGFQATYRVVAFGTGSVQMLLAIPIIGPLFALVMHLVVLTYGFKNAHGISGGKALLATILPTLAGVCCAGTMFLLYLPTFLQAMKEAYGN
jgi:phage FluMu protein Com